MKEKICRYCNKKIEGNDYNHCFYGGYTCDDDCEENEVNKMHRSQDER